jgi:hypothetical protein
MQIVLEHSDLNRLSPDARREVLALLTAGETAAPPAPETGVAKPNGGLKWRSPFDLGEEQARQLVQGLSASQKKRLALFASRTGRVRMKDIMAVGGDADLRTANNFTKQMTRRLRHLINDPERKAQLIQWDFDSTKWDASKTTIVDGVYYVSPATAQSLRRVLGSAGR